MYLSGTCSYPLPLGRTGGGGGGVWAACCSPYLFVSPYRRRNGTTCYPSRLPRHSLPAPSSSTIHATHNIVLPIPACHLYLSLTSTLPAPHCIHSRCHHSEGPSQATCTKGKLLPEKESAHYLPISQHTSRVCILPPTRPGMLFSTLLLVMPLFRLPSYCVGIHALACLPFVPPFLPATRRACARCIQKAAFAYTLYPAAFPPPLPTPCPTGPVSSHTHCLYSSLQDTQFPHILSLPDYWFPATLWVPHLHFTPHYWISSYTTLLVGEAIAATSDVTFNALVSSHLASAVHQRSLYHRAARLPTPTHHLMITCLTPDCGCRRGRHGLCLYTFLAAVVSRAGVGCSSPFVPSRNTCSNFQFSRDAPRH